MKGYGGFHGKKKPTLYKSIELEQMASGTSDYAGTEIDDYGKITGERLPMSGGEYSHESGDTFPRGGQRDYFDNKEFAGDDWQGNYSQGDQFTPSQDTASSRGGGTFNLKQEDIEQIKRMNPKNLSTKDKAIRERLLKATQGSKDKGDFQIELRPNEFQGVRAKSSGKGYSNRWTSGAAYLGKEGKEGFSDLSEFGKYKNADLTNFLLNIPSGEGAIPTRLPEAKLTGEKEGKVSVGKITGGEVIPEKTGKIPWDDAPKINTDARKKFYDKYNLRYDDTIEGFDRDGSPSRPQPVRRDEGNVKKKKKSKGLNLDLSQINFSDWDRPIREFFGQ